MKSRDNRIFYIILYYILFWDNAVKAGLLIEKASVNTEIGNCFSKENHTSQTLHIKNEKLSYATEWDKYCITNTGISVLFSINLHHEESNDIKSADSLIHQ